ncbi:hypothetical protein ILYODFUR_033731 [Ilyodon furcidens]|uniref:Uncharacterized protein n=1 Tax=Ilyodon furcidens TaxID=33524 RepID=A0ABV0U0J8_9TELE
MTQVNHQQWGHVPGLGSVDMWILQSSQLRVEVLTLGAVIKSVCCRGKHGQMEDVVLGYDDLEEYGGQQAPEFVLQGHRQAQDLCHWESF